jgi:ACS family glucarate transporter-like MFS transporter
MMKDLALDHVQMGRVFSAFLLGYALCQVPAGMLADRFGARSVLGIAALSWVLATALLAAAPAAGALGVLLAARFLLGVGEAPTFPAAAEAVARHVPTASRGRANGFVIAAIGLGSAVAPPLVTFLMVRFGWRTALVVSALPALGVACVWLAVKRMPPAVAASHVPGEALPAVRAIVPGAPERGSLATPSFALLTASYTLQGYVGYIFVFWFYLYLVDVRKFDLLRGALYASLPWLLSIVSIPLGGAASDALVARLGPRWGRRIVPMAGLIGGAAFLSYGARTPDARVAAVCLALATALVLSVEGPFWAAMMDVAGGRSGTAGGVMNMGSNLGGFVSPALTPVLAAAIGWENALHVAAFLAVVGGVLWLGIGPPAKTASA